MPTQGAFAGFRVLGEDDREGSVALTDERQVSGNRNRKGELQGQQFLSGGVRPKLRWQESPLSMIENNSLVVVYGYDTKVMRKLVALRKRDADDIAEEEAVLEMYKQALGM